jgi:hypothetical protein
MEIHLGVKAATYPDGTKLSDAMTWNNYGTETIPPRPIFQIAAEKVLSTEEFKQKIESYLHNVVVYRMNNQGDLPEIEKKLLTSIGQQSIAEAKWIIKGHAELQENAPSTIKKKGFNKPLYETGLMIKNLGYEVTE